MQLDNADLLLKMIDDFTELLRIEILVILQSYVLGVGSFARVRAVEYKLASGFSHF